MISVIKGTPHCKYSWVFVLVVIYFTDYVNRATLGWRDRAGVGGVIYKKLVNKSKGLVVHLKM